MLINKHRFSIQKDRKLMHKAGKQWIVVSAFVLALLGGKEALTTAHAQSSEASENSLTDQINQNFAQNRKLINANNRSNQSQQQYATTPDQTSQNIMQNAKALHSQIISHSVATQQVGQESQGRKRLLGGSRNLGDAQNHTVTMLGDYISNPNSNAYYNPLVNNQNDYNGKDHLGRQVTYQTFTAKDGKSYQIANDNDYQNDSQYFTSKGDWNFNNTMYQPFSDTRNGQYHNIQGASYTIDPNTGIINGEVDGIGYTYYPLGGSYTQRARASDQKAPWLVKGQPVSGIMSSDEIQTNKDNNEEPGTLVFYNDSTGFNYVEHLLSDGPIITNDSETVINGHTLKWLGLINGSVLKQARVIKFATAWVRDTNDFQNMLADDNNVRLINFGHWFNPAGSDAVGTPVTTAGMMQNDPNLRYVNISGDWGSTHPSDSIHYTDMHSMFKNDYSLLGIDFADAADLATLPQGDAGTNEHIPFTTKYVTNMQSMFQSDRNLFSLVVPSSFDTSQINSAYVNAKKGHSPSYIKANIHSGMWNMFKNSTLHYVINESSDFYMPSDNGLITGTYPTSDGNGNTVEKPGSYWYLVFTKGYPLDITGILQGRPVTYFTSPFAIPLITDAPLPIGQYSTRKGKMPDTRATFSLEHPGDIDALNNVLNSITPSDIYNAVNDPSNRGIISSSDYLNVHGELWNGRPYEGHEEMNANFLTFAKKIVADILSKRQYNKQTDYSKEINQIGSDLANSLYNIILYMTGQDGTQSALSDWGFYYYDYDGGSGWTNNPYTRLTDAQSVSNDPALTIAKETVNNYKYIPGLQSNDWYTGPLNSGGFVQRRILQHMLSLALLYLPYQNLLSSPNHTHTSTQTHWHEYDYSGGYTSPYTNDPNDQDGAKRGHSDLETLMNAFKNPVIHNSDYQIASFKSRERAYPVDQQVITRDVNAYLPAMFPSVIAQIYNFLNQDGGVANNPIFKTVCSDIHLTQKDIGILNNPTYYRNQAFVNYSKGTLSYNYKKFAQTYATALIPSNPVKANQLASDLGRFLKSTTGNRVVNAVAMQSALKTAMTDLTTLPSNNSDVKNVIYSNIPIGIINNLFVINSLRNLRDKSDVGQGHVYAKYSGVFNAKKAGYDLSEYVAYLLPYVKDMTLNDPRFVNLFVYHPDILAQLLQHPDQASVKKTLNQVLTTIVTPMLKGASDKKAEAIKANLMNEIMAKVPLYRNALNNVESLLDNPVLNSLLNIPDLSILLNNPVYSNLIKDIQLIVGGYLNNNSQYDLYGSYIPVAVPEGFTALKNGQDVTQTAYSKYSDYTLKHINSDGIGDRYSDGPQKGSLELTNPVQSHVIDPGQNYVMVPNDDSLNEYTLVPNVSDHDTVNYVIPNYNNTGEPKFVAQYIPNYAFNLPASTLAGKSPATQSIIKKYAQAQHPLEKLQSDQSITVTDNGQMFTPSEGKGTLLFEDPTASDVGNKSDVNKRYIAAIPKDSDFIKNGNVVKGQVPYNNTTHIVYLFPNNTTVNFHDDNASMDGNLSTDLKSKAITYDGLHGGFFSKNADGSYKVVANNSDKGLVPNGWAIDPSTDNNIVENINQSDQKSSMTVNVVPVYDGMAYKYSAATQSVEFVSGTPSSDMSDFLSGSNYRQYLKGRQIGFLGSNAITNSLVHNDGMSVYEPANDADKTLSDYAKQFSGMDKDMLKYNKQYAAVMIEFSSKNASNRITSDLDTIAQYVKSYFKCPLIFYTDPNPSQPNGYKQLINQLYADQQTDGYQILDLYDAKSLDNLGTPLSQETKTDSTKAMPYFDNILAKVTGNHNQISDIQNAKSIIFDSDIDSSKVKNMDHLFDVSRVQALNSSINNDASTNDLNQKYPTHLSAVTIGNTGNAYRNNHMADMFEGSYPTILKLKITSSDSPFTQDSLADKFHLYSVISDPDITKTGINNYYNFSNPNGNNKGSFVKDYNPMMPVYITFYDASNANANKQMNDSSDKPLYVKVLVKPGQLTDNPITTAMESINTKQNQYKVVDHPESDVDDLKSKYPNDIIVSQGHTAAEQETELISYPTVQKYSDWQKNKVTAGNDVYNGDQLFAALVRPVNILAYGRWDKNDLKSADYTLNAEGVLTFTPSSDGGTRISDTWSDATQASGYYTFRGQQGDATYTTTTGPKSHSVTQTHLITKDFVKNIVFNPDEAGHEVQLIPKSSNGPFDLFSNMKNLTSFNAANLDTSNLHDVSEMFASDPALNTVDISSMSHPTKDSDMFKNTPGLNSIKLSKDLDLDSKSGLDMNGTPRLWVSSDYSSDANMIAPRHLTGDNLQLGNNQTATWQKSHERAIQVHFVNARNKVNTQIKNVTIYVPQFASTVKPGDQLGLVIPNGYEVASDGVLSQHGLSGKNDWLNKASYPSTTSDVAYLQGLPDSASLLMYTNGPVNFYVNGYYGDSDDTVSANNWIAPGDRPKLATATNVGAPVGYALDTNRGAVDTNGLIHFNFEPTNMTPPYNASDDDPAKVSVSHYGTLNAALNSNSDEIYYDRLDMPLTVNYKEANHGNKLLPTFDPTTGTFSNNVNWYTKGSVSVGDIVTMPDVPSGVTPVNSDSDFQPDGRYTVGKSDSSSTMQFIKNGRTITIPVNVSDVPVHVKFVNYATGRYVFDNRNKLVSDTLSGYVGSDVSLTGVQAPAGYTLDPDQTQVVHVTSNDVPEVDLNVTGKKTPLNIQYVDSYSHKNLDVNGNPTIHNQPSTFQINNSDLITGSSDNLAHDLATDGKVPAHYSVVGYKNFIVPAPNGGQIPTVTVTLASHARPVTIQYVDTSHNNKVLYTVENVGVTSDQDGVKDGTKLYVTQSDPTNASSSSILNNSSLAGYHLAPGQPTTVTTSNEDNGNTTYTVKMVGNPITLDVQYYNPSQNTPNHVIGSDKITTNLEGHQLVTGDKVTLPSDTATAVANQGLSAGYTIQSDQVFTYQVRSADTRGSSTNNTKKLTIIVQGDPVNTIVPVTIYNVGSKGLQNYQEGNGAWTGVHEIDIPVHGAVGDVISLPSSAFAGYLPAGYRLASDHNPYNHADYTNHVYTATLIASDASLLISGQPLTKWSPNSWTRQSASNDLYWDTQNNRPQVVLQAVKTSQIYVRYINQQSDVVGTATVSDGDAYDSDISTVSDPTGHSLIPNGYTYNADYSGNQKSVRGLPTPQTVNVHVVGNPVKVAIKYVDVNGNHVGSDQIQSNDRIGDPVTLPDSVPAGYLLLNKPHYVVGSTGCILDNNAASSTNGDYVCEVPVKADMDTLPVTFATFDGSSVGCAQSITSQIGKTSTITAPTGYQFVKPSDASYRFSATNKDPNNQGYMKPVTIKVTPLSSTDPSSGVKPINVTYYDPETNTDEGTYTVNGKMDQTVTVSQLGTTGLNNGYAVDANQNGTYTIGTTPVSATVLVHGTAIAPTIAKDTVTIHIHKYVNDSPNGSDTKTDEISGNVGDNYTLFASDYTPAGYQVWSDGTHQSSLGGYIKSDGSISTSSMDFYYDMQSTQEETNHVRPIDVYYEDSTTKQIVSSGEISPESSDYVGKPINVTKKVSVPTGYKLNSVANPNVNFEEKPNDNSLPMNVTLLVDPQTGGKVTVQYRDNSDSSFQQSKQLPDSYNVGEQVYVPQVYSAPDGYVLDNSDNPIVTIRPSDQTVTIKVHAVTNGTNQLPVTVKKEKPSGNVVSTTVNISDNAKMNKSDTFDPATDPNFVPAGYYFDKNHVNNSTLNSSDKLVVHTGPHGLTPSSATFYYLPHSSSSDSIVKSIHVTYVDDQTGQTGSDVVNGKMDQTFTMSDLIKAGTHLDHVSSHTGRIYLKNNYVVDANQSHTYQIGLTEGQAVIMVHKMATPSTITLQYSNGSGNLIPSLSRQVHGLSGQAFSLSYYEQNLPGNGQYSFAGIDQGADVHQFGTTDQTVTIKLRKVPEYKYGTIRVHFVNADYLGQSASNKYTDSDAQYMNPDNKTGKFTMEALTRLVGKIFDPTEFEYNTPVGTVFDHIIAGGMIANYQPGDTGDGHDFYIAVKPVEY